MRAIGFVDASVKTVNPDGTFGPLNPLPERSNLAQFSVEELAEFFPDEIDELRNAGFSDQEIVSEMERRGSIDPVELRAVGVDQSVTSNPNWQSPGHKRIQGDLRNAYIAKFTYELLENGPSLDAITETLSAGTDLVLGAAVTEAIKSGNVPMAIAMLTMKYGSEKLNEEFGSGKFWREQIAKINGGDMQPEDWTSLNGFVMDAVGGTDGIDIGDRTWASTHASIMQRSNTDPIKLMYQASMNGMVEDLTTNHAANYVKAAPAIEWLSQNASLQSGFLDEFGKATAVTVALAQNDGNFPKALDELLRARGISEADKTRALEIFNSGSA